MASGRFLRRATAILVDDLPSRDRYDELAAPRADARHLLDDLVFEVPGQHEHVVGLRLENPLRRVDRHAHSRDEPALLMWTAVDGVREQVRADAAIVEQRGGLCGCAVA